MKSSKAKIASRVHQIPEIRFEDQRLTSSAGLVLFQLLFNCLDLKSRLRQCFRHLNQSSIYGHVELFLILTVHILQGYRHLRDIEYYRDDPIVLRTLGLRRLPDESTISRRLRALDVTACDRVRKLSREMVLDRLSAEDVARITMDYDGSVCSTRRYAEGTAVGFNRKRKGDRGYYPLLCTVAQTGQVLDVLHRSGNVHDSNGSADFIRSCVLAAEDRCSGAVIESRLDGAFFSEGTVSLLQGRGVEYTISVPFERIVALKETVERRKRWRWIDDRWSYFELKWKPKKWSKRSRFIFCRQLVARRSKKPVQLDLFEPVAWNYCYKVIVTNKRVSAKSVIAFHHGRGSQEGIIGEVKSLCQMDYIPTRSWAGNRMYMHAGIMAHNLTRELQMQTKPRCRTTTATRPALWVFEKLSSIRNILIRRAGRLTKPGGRLVLTMSGNEAVRRDFKVILQSLLDAA